MHFFKETYVMTLRYAKLSAQLVLPELAGSEQNR